MRYRTLALVFGFVVMPLCYERDVTQKMVDEYRKRTRS